MRILYTSDIHADPSHLQSMARAAQAHDVDALIVGGDVVPHHLPGASDTGILEAQALYLETRLLPELKRLKRQMDIRIFIDLGNDDFAANRSILEDHAGDLVDLLHMQKHALTDQVDLVGYMVVPPTPFTRKDWEKPDCKQRPFSPGNDARLDGYTSRDGELREFTLDIHGDDTMAADLAQISSGIRGPFIFVAHCPPYNTPLDLLFNGTHVGSLSIRDFIEHWSDQGELIAALHGHIHEAPLVSGTNRTLINQTLSINPGQGSDLHYVVLELGGREGGCRIEISAP